MAAAAGNGDKAAQSEGDAKYWPIYNLDQNNSHAKAGLEHADPKDLITHMRSHETEVIRLLSEIETLMHEVGNEHSRDSVSEIE